MKNFGNIILYVLVILAFVSLIWVSVTPDAAGAEIDMGEWMNKPVTTFVIVVTLVALAITTVLFAVYKVYDWIKFPKNLRETAYVLGAILISGIIGFVLSGSEDVTTPLLTVGGMKSKLIGTAIIMTGILLVTGLIFLIWDTLKALIKS